MRDPRANPRFAAPLVLVTLAVLGLAAPARAQEEDVPPPPQWQPAGTVHFVLQGGATGVGLFVPDDTRGYLGGELAAGADVRLLPELHLRALLVGAGQGHEDFRGFDAGGQVVERRGTGFVSGGVRLMVGVVLAQVLGLRLGGELGFEGVASLWRMTSYGGGLFEVAARLADEERLELVLQAAVQSRAIGYWQAVEPAREPAVVHELAVRGLFAVAWLF